MKFEVIKLFLKDNHVFGSALIVKGSICNYGRIEKIICVEDIAVVEIEGDIGITISSQYINAFMWKKL